MENDVKKAKLTAMEAADVGDECSKKLWGAEATIETRQSTIESLKAEMKEKTEVTRETMKRIEKLKKERINIKATMIIM